MVNLNEVKKILDTLIPQVAKSPETRIRLNCGMGLDLPTGSYYRNPNGRYVLNGGLQLTTGFAGLPNTFKSSLMMRVTVTVVDRLLANGVPTQVTTNDTENTLEQPRIQYLIDNNTEVLKQLDPFTSGMWVLTTSAEQDGTDWWEAVRNTMREKIKSNKTITVDSPIIGKNGQPIRVLLPTFYHIDSLTRFRSKDTDSLDDSTELGDSKGLTLFMKAGLAKARLLTTLTALAEKSNSFFLISAHVGEQGPDMNANKYAPPPDKKLPTMRSNQQYKGVTENFYSLLAGIWQTHKVRPTINKDKKPLYPKDSNDNEELDPDLQTVTVQLMRSKSSGDGYVIEQIISKTEGFLVELSEFHRLRENNYYGLVGSNVNFACALLPDVKLTRTTVRQKLKDPILARAINICSEMWQIFNYRKLPPNKGHWEITPEELYTKLIELGYDWNKILTSRGWHSLGVPPKGVITVTTMDLLAVAGGELDIPEIKLEQPT